MIHKEGYITLIVGLIALVIANLFLYKLFPENLGFALSTTIIIYLFILYFFRDPHRSVVEENNNIILSPCDGKVVVVEKVSKTEFLNDDRIQVSVFMSPLNVHINWYPISGEIIYSKYHPGKYLFAWNPKASTDNERHTVCLQVGNKKLLIKQIAGAMARRIVCYAKKGDRTTQGSELGFIKFGSRVDIYLPLDSNLKVKPGDIVKGNISEIASW